MELIKKHYEKVLLGLVLLGLTIAVTLLPFIISAKREALRVASDVLINRKIQPLPPLEMALQEGALQKAQSAIKLDFTTKHNLLNPVVWQKTADGRPVKIMNGNEMGGAGALQVIAIKPLYMKLTFDSTNGNGFFINIDRPGAAKEKDRHKQALVSMENTRTDLLTLKKVNGPPEKPELLVELNDTQESFTLSAEKPFQKVDGYVTDLRYPPEPGRSLTNLRVGASLKFGELTYIIVAITESEVVLMEKRIKKKTTITFNPQTVPR